MIRTLNGQLQIKVANFRPTKNIEFGIINESSFTSIPKSALKPRDRKIVFLGNLDLKGDYTKEELRLLRNTIYAQYGFDFQSSDLKRYFSQFAWYMPDPNLKMEEIILTEKEKAFIEKIVTKEQE